jgi:hypothetical protein
MNAHSQSVGKVVELVVGFHLLALLLPTVGLGATAKEHGEEKNKQKPAAAEARVQRDATGAAVIIMDEATQKRLGLKVEPLAAAQMNREAKAYGRVLDPAPLGALAMELASAQTALENSQHEFERVKTLYEQGRNASTRAYQAAEAAARHNQVQVESLRLKLVSAWGNAIAQEADLPALARSLASLESALVRLDLLAGEFLEQAPIEARVVSVGDEKRAAKAALLGPAPSVEARMQGQGWLFLLKPNSLRLAPGAAVVGKLRLPGEPLRGVIVPSSAMVRVGEKACVYLQRDKRTFSRRQVRLAEPTEGGWFVSSGLAPKDRVVVVGAQALLSEEFKSQIKILE